VVGNLHLVDGDAVRRHRDRLLDARLPAFVRVAHHAGNQVDIDLGEAGGARKVVGAVDLFRAVRAAVELQDALLDVLHPEAKAGDAQVTDELDLRLGERARLAFEGDLLRRVPGKQLLHAVREVGELPG